MNRDRSRRRNCTRCKRNWTVFLLFCFYHFVANSSSLSHLLIMMFSRWSYSREEVKPRTEEGDLKTMLCFLFYSLPRLFLTVQHAFTLTIFFSSSLGNSHLMTSHLPCHHHLHQHQGFLLFTPISANLKNSFSDLFIAMIFPAKNSPASSQLCCSITNWRLFIHTYMTSLENVLGSDSDTSSRPFKFHQLVTNNHNNCQLCEKSTFDWLNLLLGEILEQPINFQICQFACAPLQMSLSHRKWVRRVWKKSRGLDIYLTMIGSEFEKHWRRSITEILRFTKVEADSCSL